MKQLFSIICTLIIISNVTSQNIFHEWSFNPKDTALYGGEVRIIGSASDDLGNSYSIGSFRGFVSFENSQSEPQLSPTGVSDMYVVKYDEIGNYLWSFGIGGTGTINPSSITVENNQFIYIVGSFYNTADFDPSENEFPLTALDSEDAFIAKYDTSGSLIWAKVLNGTSSDYAESIGIDSDGNILITGGFNGNLDFDPSANEAIYTTTGSGRSIFIAKYDNDGNYLWAKTMNGTGLNNIGFDLALDSENNIVITGRLQGTVDFDPSTNEYNLTATSGSIHFFLAKYNSDGDFIWAFSGGSTANTEGTSLDIDTNDNVFLTGVFYGGVDFDPSANSAYLYANSYDMFLAKYNPDGEYVWAKKIGGNGWYNRAWKVLVDSMQNILLTGYMEGGVNFDPSGSNFMLYAADSDGFLAKYTNDGNFEWAFRFGGSSSDYGVSIAEGRNGNIFLGGNFRNSIYLDYPANTAMITSGQDAINSFVASYTSSGVYAWGNRIGGFTNRDYQQTAKDVISDSDNNVYFTGSFNGNVDFNPSETSENLLVSTENQTNIFLSKFSESGEYLWALSLNGDNYNEGRKLAIDENHIILGGTFSGDVDFNPSVSEDSIIVPSVYNSNNIFLAKYTTNGDFVWAFNLWSNETSYITGVKIDDNGNIYLSGYSYGTIDLDPSSGSNQFDADGDNVSFIAKYSSTGSLIWAKQIQSTGGVVVEDIALNEQSEIFLTGNFKGNAQFNATNSNGQIASSGIYDEDIFIAKFNAIGNFEWVKKIGNDENDQTSTGIALDNQSNLYITGDFRGTLDFDPSTNLAELDAGNSYDIFLAKYSSDGNFLWVNSTEGEESCYASKVTVDKNNNPFISGKFRGEIQISSSENSLNLTSNGNNTDILIAQFDDNGGLKTAKKIGGKLSENIYGLHITANNSLLLCGDFNINANFNTNEPEIILNTLNGRDAFVASYTICDNYYINETIQSCGPYTASNGVTYIESGIYDIYINTFLPDCDTIKKLNLIITEIDTEVTVTNHTLTATYEEYNTQYQWYNCTDNQPIADAINQSFTPMSNGSYKVKITNGNCDEFSDCIDVTNVSLKELESNLNISIYPNPTNGQFEVLLNNHQSNLMIEIYDLIGNKIVSVNSEGKPVITFDLNQHASGVYLVKVSDKLNTKTLKLVKQ